jgi:hypothetical protein
MRIEWTRRRRVLVTIAGAFAAFFLTSAEACSRTFEPGPNWQQVPGASAMWRFCDGPILIYASIVSGSEDNIEGMFAGWCEWNGTTWLPALAPPVPGAQPSSAQGQLQPGQGPTRIPGEDTNQQDERDEK